MSDTSPHSPPHSTLEARLGYRFADDALLTEALTHPSWANVAVQRGEAARDNERLEFLGDAVLDLVVGERLFHVDPDASPGTLTQRRIALVGQPRLARLGVELELGALLRVGPGEDRTRVSAQPATLADTFEAVLGAVYLDGGLAAAGAVIDRLLGAELTQLKAPAQLKNEKVRLQELVQGVAAFTPRYRVVSEGPEVQVEVSYGPGRTANGHGPTRRAAERAAAAAALTALATQPLSPRRSANKTRPASSQGE